MSETHLCNAQQDFVANERIVWVDIEVVPLHAWSRNTFLNIGSIWGEVMEVDDGNDDLFARKRLCIRTNQVDNILESFKISVKGKVFRIRAKELFVWSPSFSDAPEASHFSDDESINGDAENVMEVKSDSEAIFDTFFGDNKDEKECAKVVGQPSIANEGSTDPFNIYELLNKRDKDAGKFDTETRVPYPPGFTPPKNSQGLEDQHLEDADFVRSQSKSEGCNSHIFEGVVNSNINLSPKDCAKGNLCKEGGSILEVLDEMIKVGQAMGFAMDGCTRDMENIIRSQGEHETKMEKISEMEIKYLWGNYNFGYSISEALGNSGGILCAWDPSIFHKDHHIIFDNFIALWNGESMVMGDFNEVRCPEERWGSNFSTQGARIFNSFISNLGLNDIQLEGLVGFEQMVTSTSNSFILEDGNGMIRFRKKLQLLKKVIRGWVTDLKRNQSARIRELKAKLIDIDKLLDLGKVFDDILLSRIEAMKQLQEIKSSDSRDSRHFMQNAKIRWAIEGDKNSKFFHGVIYRKRANLSVKGIMACGENKSSGPDGYTFEFFREFWNVIGPDLCIAVQWFFEHGSFTSGCNSSFVTVIPKTLDPKVVNDYRPISLIGCIYKIVTKILASWLSLVISSLISDVQTTFLSNRQILDGPLIINEILSRCKIKKQQAMIFKGDPLAPFLFILIMESLHLSFIRSIDTGIFTGIKLHPSLTISHIFYADDAVFIGEWTNDNLKGVVIPDNLVNAAALSFSCSVMKFPFEYLRVRVGDKMSWLRLGMKRLLSSGRGYLSGNLRRYLSEVISAAHPLLWCSIIKEMHSLKAREFAKDSSVVEKFEAGFSSSFCRTVRGGAESYQLDHLLILLESVILSNSVDRWVCDLNGDEEFRAKDIRSMLDESFLSKGDVPTRWIKSGGPAVTVVADRSGGPTMVTFLLEEIANIAYEAIKLKLHCC
nr:RNA-directed DNA polymerase, eukaryota [Tanacetum cinerariifolium]